MLKNTAGQRKRVFAFNSTTGAPVTGDAANITATFELDNAAPAATNDVNPTEASGGFYDFDMTQAETNCNRHATVAESATAGVSVIGVPGVEYPSVNVAPVAPYSSRTGKIELTRLSDYKTGTPVGPLLIPITANNVAVDDVVRFGAELECEGSVAERIYVEGVVVSSDGSFYASFEIEGSTVLNKTPSLYWKWGLEHVNDDEDETAIASDKELILHPDRVVSG